MEPQPLIGVSMDRMQAILQRKNQAWNPRMLGISYDMMLIYVYESLPSPASQPTPPPLSRAPPRLGSPMVSTILATSPI
jgi:hypothetical protein